MAEEKKNHREKGKRDQLQGPVDLRRHDPDA
jgi:hypothetical protein